MMKRRMLALLLVLTMLLPMIPMGTLAEEVGETAQTNEEGEGFLNQIFYGFAADDNGNMKLKVMTSVHNTPVSAHLVVAAYDRNDKMLDSDWVSKLNEEEDLEFYLDADNCYVKAFLLDEDMNLLEYGYGEWTNFYEEENGNDAGEDASEATEETVPETTEETVPETTEETVPETTEETVPETVEETTEAQLTGEEAAEEGYYVAPEGAQLQEEAEVEEMAFFSGTDKGGKVHTATFTGLVPHCTYLFISSTETSFLAVAPGNLQYIDEVYTDANGVATVNYTPRTTTKSIVQLYGPEKLTVTVNDYLTIREGQTQTVQLESNIPDTSFWALDDGDYTIPEYLEVKNGDHNGEFKISLNEKAAELTEPTSCYITFWASVETGRYQDASVTVRVDYIPDTKEVEAASLGETTAARNLYDSDPTELPIFLQLKDKAEDQESTVSETNTLDAAEDDTGLITEVEFAKDTPELITKFFRVSVKNDHTLLLYTNEQDWEDAETQKDIKALKSSYANLKFLLTIDGQEEPIPVSNALKLTVQKKLPAIKAETVTLSPYYRTKVSNFGFTGGEVTGIDHEHADKGDLPVFFENWGIPGEGLSLNLKENVTKAASGNIKVPVWVKGCLVPVTATIPVKIEVKSPALKLGVTSKNVSSVGVLQEWIPITCTTKGMELKDLDVQYEVELSGTYAKYYDAYYEDGYLFLVSNAFARPAGKHALTANVTVGTLSIPLNLTLNNQDPTTKLNVSSISVNTAAGEVGKAYYTISGLTEELELDVETKKDTPELTVDTEILSFNENRGIQTGEITIEGEDEATGTNAVVLKYEDKTLATLNVTLTKARPSVTLKAEDTLNAYDDNTWVKLIPTLSNTSGWLDGEEPTWTVKKTTGKQDDVTDQFRFVQSKSGNYWVLRSASGAAPAAGTYKVTYSAGTWTDGKPVEASATFTVKATKNPLSIKGKLNVLDSSTQLDVSTTVVKYYTDDDGVERTALPTVEIWTTTKNDVYKVDDSEAQDIFYFGWEHEELLHLYPNGGDLAAGKYTIKLIYDSINTGTAAKPKSLEVSTTFNVSRTPIKQKVSKTSVTVHPLVETPVTVNLWTDRYEDYATFDYEVYDSKGKEPVEGEINVTLGYYEGAAAPYVMWISGTGNAPEKDTTYKIKLIPDTRAENNFTWLTVKVLGESSVKKMQQIKLTSKGVWDPSRGDIVVSLSGTYKGFGGDLYAVPTLYAYDADEKNYVEVAEDDCYLNAYAFDGMIRVSANTWDEHFVKDAKYRLVVEYYGDEECTNLVATSTNDLKTAYGSNRFTVAKAPTLYKADPYAHMDVHIDARQNAQHIGRVEIKNGDKLGFEIKQSYTSGKDYEVWYTGADASKLRSTTLTLQIFLLGNETDKPNATVSLKVNVK